MSKIGNWVLETEERKAELRHTNPYDRHSNTDNATRQYYVDYDGYRNKHQPRQNLGSGDAGRRHWRGARAL